jgi:hypothetical protein
MIYEINVGDVEACKLMGAHCFCISNDQLFVLVSSQNDLGSVVKHNEYLHTEINEVLALEKWYKICEECS